VVVLIVTKAVAKTCRLIEEPLVVHHISHCWLGLTKSDLFRNVSVLITFILALSETCLFTSTVPFVLFSEHTPNFIAFPPGFVELSLLITLSLFANIGQRFFRIIIVASFR
jgi:hypothetical protein